MNMRVLAAALACTALLGARPVATRALGRGFRARAAPPLRAALSAVLTGLAAKTTAECPPAARAAGGAPCAAQRLVTAASPWGGGVAPRSYGFGNDSSFGFVRAAGSRFTAGNANSLTFLAAFNQPVKSRYQNQSQQGRGEQTTDNHNC